MVCSNGCFHIRKTYSSGFSSSKIGGTEVCLLNQKINLVHDFFSKIVPSVYIYVFMYSHC